MISVIMPIYNGEQYLRDAVESILAQSYTNFELICIDDGSTDGTLNILKEYAAIDSRLVIISRENKGLIATLNEGIVRAKYNYIARMDADDISHVDRFMLQVEYLNTHPDVAVVGCAYEYINESGAYISTRKTYNSDFMLKTICLLGSPFAHPSVMINRSILNDDLYYDQRYKHSEDYELWVRLSQKYKFGGINKVLLKYRVLNSSVSRQNFVEQKMNMAKAARNHLFKNRLSDAEVNTLSALYIEGRFGYQTALTILKQRKKMAAIIQLGYLFIKR
ncbi:glycosyltransferase [Aeromonas sp. FDAARGOS 1411]|uniref:glycosyltransferase family 2 protein n=1 Tax=Aeromonas TaxID=642 RepID=UPI00084BA1E5|nr:MULTISPECIES: glycosyltransferase [unclassified Aeromonas]OEC44544.1 hypothetical protein A9G06_13050 [Aeromonas sp. DNP9]QWZ92801.1 glycosyltransferase [Aeromonas sp. FDAARGOS 1411]